MEPKIDDNVPLPPNRYEYGMASRLKSLQISQSFEFPLEQRTKYANIAQYVHRKYGGKFSIRKLNSDTARIWRVE